jgi:hypothetical protein
VQYVTVDGSGWSEQRRGRHNPRRDLMMRKYRTNNKFRKVRERPMID